MKVLKGCGIALLAAVILITLVWAYGALFFDEPSAGFDPAAKAADDSPDFSRLIRVGRPGFGADDATLPSKSQAVLLFLHR